MDVVLLEIGGENTILVAIVTSDPRFVLFSRPSHCKQFLGQLFHGAHSSAPRVLSLLVLHNLLPCILSLRILPLLSLLVLHLFPLLPCVLSLLAPSLCC